MMLKNPTKIRRRGLSLFDQLRLRHRLRRSACSETWIDDQIITIPGVGQLHDPRVFPPGGRLGTKMRWCRCCGRYTPPCAVNLIETRHVRSGPVISATLKCDDCHIADEDALHRELHEAGLHLRPAGSRSFIPMQTLRAEQRKRFTT